MEPQLLMGYYITHRALRKDSGRLKTVIDKFNSYSQDDWKKIADWFDYHLKLVHFHHHGEDEFFFPWIKERSSKFPRELQQMDDEHKTLVKFMDKMQSMMHKLKQGASGIEDEFKNIAIAYGQLLINHLDDEEKFVSIAIKEFTPDEVLAAEEQYRKMMTREQQNLSLAWMADAMTEEEKKAFFSMTPFFVKWIYRWKAKPAFDKMVSCI